MTTTAPTQASAWDAYIRDTALDAVMHRGALQNAEELAGLMTLLHQDPPSVFVEIGTCHGGAWHALTKVCTPTALCISLDLPRSIDPANRSQEELQASAGEQRSVRKVWGDSQYDETRDALIEALDGNEIDALFIDGHHAYDYVKRDHELYAPLVRTGGIIAFHDINRTPNVEHNCDVYRYWPEIKPMMTSGYQEFVVDGAGFGIGAYTKP